VNLGTGEHFLKNTEIPKKRTKQNQKIKTLTRERETGIKRHFPCIKTFEDKMGS
jgi:hypothetical protein